MFNLVLGLFIFSVSTLPTGHNERGAYLVKGSVEVNGITYTDGKLLVFTKGADPLIIAKENTTLMMPGGEYLRDRYMWWNFVSSSKGTD